MVMEWEFFFNFFHSKIHVDSLCGKKNKKTQHVSFDQVIIKGDHGFAKGLKFGGQNVLF